MNRNITNWCKAWLDCQQSKISRNNHLAPADFVAPDGRFKYVHMDIVGPLPESSGYKYCLTMIDRSSRWPEAVPLKDIEALTLFTALLQLTGCRRIRTTAYHPSSNGMIERWHRCLKAAIMCHSGQDWSRSLSTVLLDLRSNVMEIGSSPAEFIYGTTLRIPGEFVLPEDFTPDPKIFLQELREHMRSIKPVPVGHKYKKRAFLHKDLKLNSHVFLRVGTAKRSL
ncbi:uncharacterized protein LOC117177875 [Belonocnema kinseyi]|uniref:uncharacterized protein LOC117177875 n=1 Tax=Belonocnema kinseyi TaxID=2817044 RepID=UPI00143D08EB|nr:uncharacterized protein LOC117177875 [Belonocnema kinseyi]